MPDLTAELLPRLKSHRIPELVLDDEFIHPYYQGASILNIPSTICDVFGVPSFGHNPLLPEITNQVKALFNPSPKNIVLLLVDALALHRLQRWMADGTAPIWERLVQNGVFAPITSVFPSTTSTALPTIWSGLSPAQHGMVGYELWLQEYGVVANMITHSPMYIPGRNGRLEAAGFEPDKALPGITLGYHLMANRVEPHAFQHSSIVNSGLSRVFFKDVKVHSYHTSSELWVNLRQLLESKPDERLLVGLYSGSVDGQSHVYGPDNEHPAAEFSHFSQAFQKFFLDEMSLDVRKDTMFILIADHGQIMTHKNYQYELKNHPEFMRRLHIRPTGENRATYFHVRPGQIEAVREYLDRTFMQQFVQVDPGYAIRKGLFGPGDPHPRLPERVGDTLALARQDAYLWWGDKPNPIFGRHGGLHHEEMIVPFLAAAL